MQSKDSNLGPNMGNEHILLAWEMIVGEYKLLPRSVHTHVVNNDEHGFFQGENIQMDLFSIFKTETLVSRSTLHSGFNLFEVLSAVDFSNLETFPSLWFISRVSVSILIVQWEV